MPVDGLEELDALSLRGAAARAGHDIALVTDHREWTFAELLEAVRRQNSDRDDGPSERTDAPRRVCLWGHRTPASLLRLYWLLDRGDVVTLLHPSWTKAAAGHAASRTGCSIEYDDEVVRRHSVDSEPGAEDAEGLEWVRGLILFTSGTTGSPKGVVLSRHALITAAEASARRLGWQVGDRWLLRLPIAHVGGLSIVTRCLAAGAAVVLDPSPSFEPVSFVERVERTGTTLISLVPTMLHRLVEAGLRAPATVRLALIGGAAVRRELLERAVDLGWPTAPTYGMTEACSQIATVASADRGRPVEHVGRELDGFTVRLVEPESGRVVAEGEAGLLQIRGPGLFDGYLGDPRRDPDQWFETGDWARRGEDGNLEILARRTDLIVTGGENVAPTRIEEALVAHPDVEDACVVGVPDPEWGQRVAALVVLRRGRRALTPSSMEEFLRSRLSGFEMPRRLVWVDTLPTSPSGKLDRRAARRMLDGGDEQVAPD